MRINKFNSEEYVKMPDLKKKALNIELLGNRITGALCNKLFQLFSACDIAIKSNMKLIEPYFDRQNKIRFGDIYDINHFNKNMTQYGIKNLIVRLEESDKYKIVSNMDDLWGYAKRINIENRRSNHIDSNCMSVAVMTALKLDLQYKDILQEYSLEDKTAIHIRLDSGWENYSKGKQVPEDEILVMPVIDLLNLFKGSEFKNSDIFFTTVENHKKISCLFKKNKIKNIFFYRNELGQVINAALNFCLCVNSKNFIGISRSTFSNLITLKRSIIGKNNSYIYNRGKIEKRIDKGLHADAKKAVNNRVQIIDGMV